MIDLICTSCSAHAVGTCENCDAPICAEHDGAWYKDVYICTDLDVCAARVRENKLVDGELSAI